MIGWDLILILTHKKRTISTNESDKNFFNLMNNLVYGKIMENLRKRIKIRVAKYSQDFIKYI